MIMQKGKVWVSVVILTAGCLFAAATAPCAETAMKGPEARARRPAGNPSDLETSSVRLVLSGAIGLYRSRISPLSGSRCGFYPSCSAFGLQAIREYGAFRGVMMTGDRLLRCNLFKKPGPDYFPLSGGLLLDPVSRNALISP